MPVLCRHQPAMYQKCAVGIREGATVESRLLPGEILRCNFAPRALIDRVDEPFAGSAKERRTEEPNIITWTPALPLPYPLYRLCCCCQQYLRPTLAERGQGNVKIVGQSARRCPLQIWDTYLESTLEAVCHNIRLTPYYLSCFYVG